MKSVLTAVFALDSLQEQIKKLQQENQLLSNDVFATKEELEESSKMMDDL